MISYVDYKKKLTPDEHAKVDELAQKLIAEEKALREKSGDALTLDDDQPQESASV